MKILPLFLLLAYMMIVGCGATRAIYGVPSAQWARMSEPERQARIERFERQQEINAQTRIEAEKTTEKIHTQAEQIQEETEEFVRQCYETEDDLSNSEKCEVITRRRVWLPISE